MRIPRIYHPAPLQSGTAIVLTSGAANHLMRVLRLKPGAPVIVFNGEGGEYAAVLGTIGKDSVEAHIRSFDAVERESPLDIRLAQGISRGERMDYTIQKAVELGVTRIQPLFTERCGVQLQGERLNKRRDHWQAVAVSACEQCGRNRIPVVEAPTPLDTWLNTTQSAPLRIVLDARADRTLTALARTEGPIILLAGPEGGLSDDEIARARAAGFGGVHLGPRILRTETAALAALAALQACWGDFN